jgi:hypothetical protein
MKTRPILAFAAALTMTSLAAISSASAWDISASLLPRIKSDADLAKICVSTGDSPQSCACQVKVMHEVLTDEEIRWATWVNTNKKTAIAALLVVAMTDPARVKAMGSRMRDGADIVDRRCDVKK